MNVEIDQHRCRGHARCLDIAAEAFEFLDDEDRAVVVDAGVRRTDIGLLREAQQACPEQAISIEGDNTTEKYEVPR